jgi:hypothetical protein
MVLLSFFVCAAKGGMLQRMKKIFDRVAKDIQTKREIV